MAEHPNKHVSELEADFYKWIGMCISKWASVDEELFELFHDCMQADKEKCAIVFYRQPSLDVRLSLVSDIVKSIMSKKQEKLGKHKDLVAKRWNFIENNIRLLLRTRNKIAHHQVHLIHQFQNYPATEIGYHSVQLHAPDAHVVMSYHIFMAKGDSLRKGNINQNPLNLNDMQNHYKKVASAWADISGYGRIHIANLLKTSPMQESPSS